MGFAAVRALFVLIAAALLAPAAAQAQQQSPLREKVDYLLIAPQPVATGDRIEVVEFFWYGCPHCNNLQPSLEAWLKRKPADVELRRVPAIFRDSWINHARIYYTLEALGELPRLHQAVYRAIHTENDSLTSPVAATAWAARNGIDAARWSAAFASPEVEKKVQLSRELTRAYSVPGTPSLIVDGRFLTSSGMAESMTGVITNLEWLIVMSREQRRGR
ncbi:MAG TPA: thiol:disulfide interchange protein DsbA/DsbL [Burkholderiales bacterium]|nr:thiol:disulfide interchange protein DsbA/DsbL [Burkholderiales bacterium]